MHNGWRTAAAVTLVAAVTLAAAPSGGAQRTADAVLGTWSNPRGTIAVRTEPCGTALCGSIVRASAEALADARDANVPRLVGTRLLQDYHRDGAGVWRGRVYVPDMGRSFASHIHQASRDRLTISGCLIGGFICRSQEWHRIS